MKRIILISLCLNLFVLSSYGQYRVNKQEFDRRDYTRQFGDPYNPTAAGVASYFIPGLGQIICGEPGRGVLFLGAYTASMVFAIKTTINEVEKSGVVVGDPMFPIINTMVTTGYGLIIFSFVVIPAIIIDIWAVVDAVRVAKVNNLAWRASNRSELTMNIKPFIGTGTLYNSACFGATVQLNF